MSEAKQMIADLDDYPTTEQIAEALAALEHEQWAHWTRYMLGVLVEPLGMGLNEARVKGIETKGMAKAREALERWRRQIETPYAELTEDEKDSDREWAQKVMALLSDAGVITE